jgi:hypothetical protein
MDWWLGIESALSRVARQAAGFDHGQDGGWAGDSAARRDDFLLAEEKEHKSAAAKAFPSAVQTECQLAGDWAMRSETRAAVLTVGMTVPAMAAATESS